MLHRTRLVALSFILALGGCNCGDGSDPDGGPRDGALLDGALADGELPDGALPDGARPDGSARPMQLHMVSSEE